MAGGDRDFIEPLRDARRPPGRRLLSLALVLGAAAGCGHSSPDPAGSAPPLPRYWHGSIEGPQPEAWAEAWPREWSLNDAASVTTDAREPAQFTEPYAIPELPPRAPALELSHEPAPQRHAVEAIAAAPDAVAVYGERSNVAQSSGLLLPPEPVVEVAELASPQSAAQQPAVPAATVAEATQPSLQFPTDEAAAAPITRVADRPAGDKQALRTTAPQPSPGAPTGAVVNDRATARIRHGFELAERGAYFAARNEFVDVLRMIASAKDQMYGSPRRTLALADGLRALDEAADFSPAAAGVGELRHSVIVASHQTPVAKSLAVDGMLPEQLADAYLEYAGRQLGAAVAGEPAGSMALHALGKLHSRLGRVEPEQNPQADRCAFALQQAALLARSDNHMAAHELGVLLAEGGHLAESGMMLRQVAERAPDPVVFRNLARVESQLGRPDVAAAYQRSAELLAARGNAPGGPVQWVPPATLARTPDPLAPPANPMMARGAAAPVRR
jgi:hypothetical protein